MEDPSVGDVYIADRNNARIDKFGPSGEFLLAWGWGVADGKSEELQACGPATGPATAECHPGREGAGGGEFERPVGVAVDDSTNALDPSKGDVYIEDERNHRIQKFTPGGKFLLAWGEEGSGPGQFAALEPPRSPSTRKGGCMSATSAACRSSTARAH